MTSDIRELLEVARPCVRNALNECAQKILMVEKMPRAPAHLNPAKYLEALNMEYERLQTTLDKIDAQLALPRAAHEPKADDSHLIFDEATGGVSVDKRHLARLARGTAEPPKDDTALQLVLARNALGNLYTAVKYRAQYHGHADEAIAMREAERVLGPPYSTVTKQPEPPSCVHPFERLGMDADGVMWCVQCHAKPLVIPPPFGDSVSTEQPEPPSERRTAWMIEARADGPTRYRCFVSDFPDWTLDVNAGLQFSRRQDAEAFAGGDPEDVRIVEHLFVGAPVTKSEQLKPGAENFNLSAGIKADCICDEETPCPHPMDCNAHETGDALDRAREVVKDIQSNACICHPSGKFAHYQCPQHGCKEYKSGPGGNNI